MYQKYKYNYPLLQQLKFWSYVLQIHSLMYKMIFAQEYLFAELETIQVSTNSEPIK